MAAATISTPTTIGCGDASYDDQDVVVEGTTLTVTCAHTFRSLVVRSNAVVTHVAGDTNGLHVNVLGDLTVEAGGAIIVDGKGYAARQGPGAGGPGTGGSYGGVGGMAGVGTYGAATEPVDLGSGGGGEESSHPDWARGGGLVLLTVGGTLSVDGVISSGGNWTWGGGCGSGGSVNLRAARLRGGGLITAPGGSASMNQDAAGGGGGRVAIRVTTNTFTGLVLACGGSIEDSPRSGRGGSVFFQAGSSVRVGSDACATGDGQCELNGLDPLELAELDVDVVRGGLVVDTEQTFKSLVVRANGSVTHSAGNGSGLRVHVLNDLTVEAGAAIEATGKGFSGMEGPGRPRLAGVSRAAGGGHGGWGGDSDGGLGGVAYGWMTMPLELGSGGAGQNARGGGALSLKVDGIVHVDGQISADGMSDSGAGAGGSLTLETRRLDGTGFITANGGDSTVHGGGGGGGGRIAISTIEGVTMDRSHIQARGGKSDRDFGLGEEGTVYFRAGDREAINATALSLDGDAYRGPLRASNQQYFAVATPPGQTVSIIFEHSDTNAWTELYVSFEKLPSLSEADWVFQDPGHSRQTITVPSTKAGTYYILIRMASTPSHTSGFSLAALKVPLALTACTPTTVGAGRTTLVVTGSRLAATNIVFTLRESTTSQLLSPEDVALMDDGSVRLTCDLSTAEGKSFDLIAANSNEISVLENALRVERAKPLDVSVRIVDRPPFRAGRPSPVEVRIRNISNVNIDYLQVDVTVDRLSGAEILSIATKALVAEIKQSVTESFGDMLYRNVAPGEERSVSLMVQPGLGPGSVNVVAMAVPLKRADFLLRIAEASEGLRGELLHTIDQNPAVDFSELMRLLEDPDTWHGFVLGAFREEGIIDDANVVAERAGVAFGMGGVMQSGDRRFVHPMGRNGAPCGCGCDGDDGGPDAGRWFCGYRGLLCKRIPVPGGGGSALGPVCDLVCKTRCSLLRSACELFGPDCSNPPIQAASDPNELVGPLGVGTERFVPPHEDLRYEIHFENVRTATAPAAEVEVRCQIGAGESLQSLRLDEIVVGTNVLRSGTGPASYSGRFDLARDRGVYVDVSSRVDPTTQEFVVRFVSVDPLTGLPPDDARIGFLPPNNESHCGEGIVAFRVRSEADAVTGTVLSNRAAIVFDFNPPVLTGVWTNTLDAACPTSRVQALQAASPSPRLRLMWSGSDEGAGVARYRVMVSEDGGPYTLCQTTAQPNGIFAGRAGHSYRFFSVAEDLVGNIEAFPEEPDASTSIMDAPELSWKVAGGAFSISWPVAYSSATVEASTYATGPWQDSGATPVRDGEEWRISVPPPGRQQFYRLRID